MRRYYEFAVVVLLLSLLALLLMQALQQAQRATEEVGVQAEAAAIRLQLIETMAHRETFGGKLPDSDNPLLWVAEPPVNYRGEVNEALTERRVWYFNRSTGVLNYHFQDGHLARFRLSRAPGRSENPGGMAGVGLLRLEDSKN